MIGHLIKQITCDIRTIIELFYDIDRIVGFRYNGLYEYYESFDGGFDFAVGIHFHDHSINSEHLVIKSRLFEARYQVYIYDDEDSPIVKFKGVVL